MHTHVAGVQQIGKLCVVDPRYYPPCDHEMKTINLINDPDLIQKILEHLELLKPRSAPDPRKPKVSDLDPIALKDFDDVSPTYDEPAIMIHWNCA
jgi:hypothetical protein